MKQCKINNSLNAAIKEGKWGNPEAGFYNKLIMCEDLSAIGNTKESWEKANKEGKIKHWQDFVREAYLVCGKLVQGPHGECFTPFSRSGCKYPHHAFRDGELVVSIPGLKAAYARAKQQGQCKGTIKEHLERHYKELGLYEDSTLAEGVSIRLFESNGNFITRHIYDLRSSTLDGIPVDINESDSFCPVRLSNIPNYMGINLCSVHSIEWSKLQDGQIVDIIIKFIPATESNEDQEMKENVIYVSEKSEYKGINTLVFDLGSVLIEPLDGRKLIMKKYPGKFNSRQIEFFVHEYYDKLEEYETASIVNAKNLYKTFLPEDIRAYSDEIFEILATSGEPYKYTEEMLKKLKEKGFKLYYLSNWHKSGFEMMKKLGKFDFLKYFIDGIVSYDAGCMKPDSKIYELLIEKFKINPKTSIFFDDKKENVDAAKKLGFNGVQFSRKTVKDIDELEISESDSIIEQNFSDIIDILSKDYPALMEAQNDLKMVEHDNSVETIEESLNWIEQFVHDDVFRENVSDFKLCKSPEQLLKWMDEIKYGWVTKDKKTVVDNGNQKNSYFDKTYVLQSPMELSNNKVGVCWDQTELERYWFSKMGYKYAVFYIEIKDNRDCPTHTFLVFSKGKKYYWFEHSWEIYKGITTYNTLRDLLQDVIKRHQKANKDSKSPVVLHWLAEVPKYGISCADFMSYAHKQIEIPIDKLPVKMFKEGNEISMEYVKEKSYDDLLSYYTEEEEETPTAEELHKEEKDDTPPPMEPEESKEDTVTDDPKEKEQQSEEPEQKKEEPPKKESLPKQTDKAEKDKNGVRRKKLYIAFIEWSKEFNNKNTFGSIFDKDAFNVSYPFVPHEMRYFYRLANPMLCVLSGDLTFFPVAELRKLNSKNKKLNEMLIFAATPNDLRVFNVADKKVYQGTEENGEIVLGTVLGDTFDIYIQNMIKKGDILNGPIHEEEPPEE